MGFVTFYYREHFPYYKANDDRWKNSVRHNLSISPHFRKGRKAPHGAGHLWTTANKYENFKTTLVRICQILNLLSTCVLILVADKFIKFLRIIFGIK